MIVDMAGYGVGRKGKEREETRSRQNLPASSVSLHFLIFAGTMVRVRRKGIQKPVRKNPTMPTEGLSPEPPLP